MMIISSKKNQLISKLFCPDDDCLLSDADRDDVQLLAMSGRRSRLDDRILSLRLEEVSRRRRRRGPLPLTTTSAMDPKTSQTSFRTASRAAICRSTFTPIHSATRRLLCSLPFH